MDIIRCPRCNKLLRVDTTRCPRCGNTLDTTRRKRKRVDDTLMPSQPTSPPASPHRAGHYSGLHPEDQPFQSSFFLRVRKPPNLIPDASSLEDDEPGDVEHMPANRSSIDETFDITRMPTRRTGIDETFDREQVPTRRPAADGEQKATRRPNADGQHRRYTQREEQASSLPTLIEEDHAALVPVEVRTPRASLGYIDDDEMKQGTPDRALADFPTLQPALLRHTPLPALPGPAKSTRKRTRAARLLFVAALIFFLVASGLLTFLLVKSNQASPTKPRLLVLPASLRVGDVLQLSGSGFAPHARLTLTRDAHLPILDAHNQPLKPLADAQGAFQIHVSITLDWNIGTHTIQVSSGQLTATASLTIQAALPGPPRLQLGVTHLDLGAGNSGAISHETMTLTNAGGGQVVWSAQSSVPWLTLNPASGTFAGSAVLTLTVNRAHLAPQSYLGQVILTQQGGATQTLAISMTVNTAPANLWLSTASLAFSGTPVQNPASQSVVIQNSGGQALNWTSGTSTMDGASWLSITPPGGLLGPHLSAILGVRVNTRNLAPGNYQGTLDFSYAGGPAQQVAVLLVVNTPPTPAMHLSTHNLSFQTKQGFNPTPQSFTISNPGNAPLNWLIQPDTNGASYLSIAPNRGSIPPGQSASVSLAPLLGNANGPINSTLTLKDSDPGTSVPAQQIAVNIAITSEPILVVDTGNLAFSYTSAPTTTSQLAIFTNTGSLPLNWALSGGASWLSVDVSNGSVATDEFGFITVTVTDSNLKPGTYTTTLTLKDTDANTVVAPQHFTVTLVVSG